MKAENEEKTDVVEDKAKKHPIKDYFACFKLDTRSIATNAIIAAMYVALTYAFYFMSYTTPQVRISEFLMLLPFFNPNYTIGLTIGCFLANIYSPAFAALTPLDMVFGTLATFLSCILESLCRQLIVASLIPAILNGFIVGYELTFLSGTDLSGQSTTIFYWTQFGWVALGEVIAVSVIGYIIFMALTKKQGPAFFRIINAKQNLNYRF
ncbi:MAG: QueT transporter family protein [Bacilli bacterium]|jgi:uncharacterized membrane protein